MYFGESILNEKKFFNIFNKKKEEQKEEINYEEIVEKWIKNPKEINIKDNSIEELIIAFKNKNISESKFKSIIKSNLNNFDYYFTDSNENAKPPINNSDWFTEYQEEELKKERVKKVYLIMMDSDNMYYYCKENNKLYSADYKRIREWKFSDCE